MAYILSLIQCKEKGVNSIGEKAKLLGFISEWFRIPSGYVIPYETIYEVVQKSLKINSEIQSTKDIEIEDNFHEELESAYNSLSIDNINKDIQSQEKLESEVVIRPSIIYPKDLDAVTYLNVSKLDKVIEYIKKEIYFIYQNNAKVAIIIQKLIKPTVSGIVELYRDKYLIKSCFGYSESIKQGENYDLIEYDKEKKEKNITTGEKIRAYVFDEKTKNINEVEIKQDYVYSLSLSEEIISEIIRVSYQLEQENITSFEFAVSNNKLYIITVKQKKDDENSKENKQTYTDHNEQDSNNENQNEENFSFINIFSQDLFSDEENTNNSSEHYESINLNDLNQNKESIKNREEIASEYDDRKQIKETFSLDIEEINRIIKSQIEKYSKINPYLIEVLNLLEKDILSDLKKMKKEDD